MEIGAIGAAMTQPQTKSLNATVGKDEFFELLITQLSNQDPLNPMEDRDFITQLAQFSTLEGMKELNSGFAEMKGLGMLGKTVVASRDADSEFQSDYAVGTVKGLFHSGDRIMLDLGEETVYLDNVKGVEETVITDEEQVFE